MEKNYYEILEIDKHASNEIIEKAYKTLVKKYHPDLQDANKKNIYEEKIKQINEAYDTLSNPEKKYQYDINLKSKENNYEGLYNENIRLKKELNYLKEQLTNLNNNQSTMMNIYQNIINKKNNNFNNSSAQFNMKNNINNASYKANTNSKQKIKLNRDYYKQDNSNNSIYGPSFSDLFKNLIAFGITFLIFYTLWHIPFIKNFIINLLTLK